MRVAIIDYGSGNLRSAAKAFERIGGDYASIAVTSDANMLEAATHIVLPGVGAFADCVKGLTSIPGILSALEKEVLKNRKPFLGVCVGMQMLFETGHEHGVHRGLGWIAGEVVKIDSQPQGTGVPLKIPHMGWNELTLHKAGHPLLQGIENGDHAYFVHSYHAACDEHYILATTEYGKPLPAIVAKDNIMGTQFHPEKSQEAGLKLIGNFLKMT